jgi:DNA-binding NarL/FixJ family response regulator
MVFFSEEEGRWLGDLSMPRMNGMDVIREIKKRCPETRILVLTAHRSEEYILATLGRRRKKG